MRPDSRMGVRRGNYNCIALYGAIPAMNEPFLITVSGCSLLAGGLLTWLATRPVYRVRVVPLPATVAHYGNVEVNVRVECKRRFGLRWRTAAATFIVQRGEEGRVAVSPTLGSSARGDEGFLLQLTGLAPGVDKVRISATPAGHTSALVVLVPVTVTEDVRGDRRIRHTAAVLSDSVRM